MAERLLELGAVLIGLAVIARIASRVGIATIPFYLLAGLAFGKGGILPLVTTQEFIHTGSEIGLILLLFMLGLEYSALGTPSSDPPPLLRPRRSLSALGPSTTMPSAASP
jgi:CPA2 family monovalent cation:H+ antiporter-2